MCYNPYMNKNYQEIISVVRGDIENLERILIDDEFFSEDVLKSIITAPAKRIRSALAFLFLRANGYEITQEQLLLQSAVELVHTASLIHDDIIDKSDVRRGNSTLNAVYGDKYAVLAGDFTLSVALKRIISLKNELITNEFLYIFSEMAKSEISQLASKNIIPTIDEYLAKTQGKTAGLFKVALESSALLAGIDCIDWKDFGFNFGTAFQIKNDLKDLKLDIENGIFTAPVIFSNGINITEDALLKTKELKNNFIKNIENKICPTNKYFSAIIELLELMKNDK